MQNNELHVNAKAKSYNTSFVNNKEKWKNLSAIGMMRCYREENSKLTIKEHYYIISKKIKKTAEPVVDKIVHYYDDENGNLVRSRQVKIGKTIYTIISREKPNAKSTAFDITKRLIESQAESLTDDLSITTESLEGCNSGGKKQ